MPTKIIQSISISAPQEKIFDYTQDYNNRLTWDTFLKEAKLIDGAKISAKGVKAWCVAKNGMGMETEYISYNRPKVTAVKMAKGPFIFKSFAGSWQFEPSPQKIISKVRLIKTQGDKNDQTLVTFTYSYTLRFPYSILKPFIKSNLNKNVKQRLVDLKTCLETHI